MTETGQSLPSGSAVTSLVQGKWPLTSPLAISAALLLVLLVALRCWVAGRMDVETDEAYYWLWSRRLAASYFDHPPMVAYLVRLGTFLFGDTILGIRSVAIVAMIAASVLVYALALILFDDRRIALVSVLWFNMMPVTAFFSIVVFPDTPAILFWVLSCVGLALVWRTRQGKWWYLVGVGAGLLLLSKYTGVFLIFGIGAWLLASPEMRPWLKRREPYVGALIGLVLFSPVIIWNAQHGWASFIKQFGRALESSSDGGLANMLAFLGEQAAFVSPLIFIFIIAGLAVATMRGLRRQEANWLLLALISAPMLVYFLVHALSAEVLANWPSAAYSTAIVAAVAAFVPRPDGPQQRLITRYGFEAASWVGLIFNLVLCAQMTLHPMPIRAAQDPLGRFSGWSELASETRAAAAAQHAAYIATGDYCINAALAFYLRDIPVFQSSEAIRYVSLPPVDQSLLSGSTGLYVEAPAFNDVVRLQPHFDAVTLIRTIWRTRHGERIEPFHVYELKGYRGGLPLNGGPARCAHDLR